MAAEAVLLNHLLPGFLDLNHLGFFAQGKNGGVSQTILGFKIIVIEKVIVRYMALIAIGHFPVGTVKPGGILGSHDVAVYTGLRPVGKIGMGLGYVKGIHRQTYKNAQDQDHWHFPLIGRNKLLKWLHTMKTLGSYSKVEIKSEFRKTNTDYPDSFNTI